MMSSDNPSNVEEAPGSQSPARASGKAPAALADQSDALDLSPEEKIVLDNAHILIQEGKKAFALDDFEAAIDSFGEASGLLAAVFDEASSVVYADVLILYGRALLQNAIQHSALMASEKLKESAAPQMDEDNDTPAGPSSCKIHFEGEPDFRQLEEDPEEEGDADEVGDGAAEPGADEGEGDEEEATDDFSTAWEVLELARLIYSKHTSEAYRSREADIMLLLGDVSLESENFDQAAKDYLSAAKLKADLPGTARRELAECHYKIALAYEYGNRFAEAIREVDQVIQILETLIAEGVAAASELRELLGEVTAKRDDLRASLAKKEAADSAGASSSSGMTEALLKAAFGPSYSGERAANAPVNDITSLVRPKAVADPGKVPAHKRPADDSTAEGESAAGKKPRTDDSA
ncbi:hypothetical protein IWQ60_004764 [Tieghemiomyces parasiticus]|uniref:Tetratricopeptide SHNi-TPR domain-containing protein n=1 Tax=Tieghemiomyces parasiticus TaxID=78921 RepID=A0A9W8A795_9FUNG|nr:hypothetical protein IWQ60_004764 [Tieghemiomyces parasiticus]